MADAVHYFPRGFKWGTATAAYQVEGNNTQSDWWQWERTPGKIADGHKSGAACGWWGGRWREDFDRAAEAGQNTHRLSVEWSRIEPRPAVWDEDALDQYRQMLKGLRERGLDPFVTLYHFTLPIWIYEKGGWENPETIRLFERYVRKVVGALGDLCDEWVTLNEPNGMAVQGWVLGTWPPGKRDPRKLLTVMPNLIKAHCAAYHAIHAVQPTARVGLAIYTRGFEPARPDFAPDRWVANLQNNILNSVFPDAAATGSIRMIGRRPEAVPGLARTQDFFGLNYYTRDYVAFDLTQPAKAFGRAHFAPGDELDNIGFNAMAPEGFFKMMRWARHLRVPIVISENGWSDPADIQRPRFLLTHLRQVWRAVNFNWPITGYYYWTLVDNFEWERGWTQRFGLWELDRETQERKPRPSAKLYAEICKTNSISSDMAARYAPELMPKMFPG
ncbi:MAG: glycoside hydrolase family 1 protein [Chloroflexi bacterium]|nr:glycoside hydrolase family 1 protein [Chloroflexota bacterium]